MFYKFTKSLTISIAVVVSLTACTANDAITPKPEPIESLFEEVSQNEFDNALSKLEVEKDEFNGNLLITQKDLEKSRVKSNKNYLILVLGLSKKENADWFIGQYTYFQGPDWMFHYEMDLKTSNGTYTTTGLDDLREDQVRPSGSVLEIGKRELTQEELASFCKVVSGEDAKIRFSGSGGSVRKVTAGISEKKLVYLNSICIVYAGISQGFQVTAK